MKTSNKILLGLISLIGLSMLGVLIFAKNSLINVENSKVIGDGKIIKVNHQIGEIAFFKTNHPYEVYIKKGDPALVIETDENIQAFLRPNFDRTVYTKKGGKSILKRQLRIGHPNRFNLHPTDNIKIYISTPSMEAIEIGGSSKLIFEDVFDHEAFKAEIYDFAEVNAKVNSQNLDLEVSGSARLDISGELGNAEITTADFANLFLKNMNANSINIKSSGNSNCSLIGATKSLDIISSDFAKINAASLNCETASIQTKSSTETILSTSQTLQIQATDFASIQYSGNPEITKNISGQAKLEVIQ